MPDAAAPMLPQPTNEQLESLVAAAPDEDLQRALRIVLGSEQAYWERDLRSGRMWYSPSFFRVLGLPPTHDRERINARIHPDDRADFEAAYGAAVRNGGSFSYDVRYLDRDERYRWARASGRVWHDAHDGRPLRLIGTLVDVHAERQARLDADAHAWRYQRALDASAEAHFEITAGEPTFFVSRNLARLLGHPPGTPTPGVQSLLQWLHPDDRNGVLATVERALAGAATWEATCRLRGADGRWRWFRARGRSALDEQGRVRASGMLGDVHQQELDRQELAQHRHHLSRLVAERTERLDAALAEAERQREQAERASRAKSEFLAHMSHELRTPLNGLLGLTELALKVADQPAQRRYLEVALASGRALQQLIGHVLDHSRLEAGRTALHADRFDLAETLAEVWRALAPEVQARGVGMTFDWVGDHTVVVGDAARVRQVVANLAANAAKFTARGTIALRAELRVEAPGAPARAVVRVEDTGPGIDPAMQERVFDAFVQGDASLTRRHGGAGLGLSIARQLARAMGGDVVLERSTPDGSVFAFDWPLALADDAAPLAPVAPGRAWLVIERAEVGDVLQARVAREGWTVERFTSLGDAAQRAVATGRAAPGVVFVGADVLAHGDADLAPLSAGVPGAEIVLLVAPHWNQPEVEHRALALGARVAVIPLTLRDLRRFLAGGATPPRREAAPNGAADGGPRPARVLIVEDNPVNLLIASEFVRQLGHEVLTAPNGAQALASCVAQAPELVLMDLQMPVMDGLEATRKLRQQQADRRLPPFPIIALTAHAGAADEREALAAGVDDYLVKPLRLETLREAVDRNLPAARGPGA
jgi:signal transduction histidine kinase/ActR/RegA family two-component response regulator